MKKVTMTAALLVAITTATYAQAPKNATSTPAPSPTPQAQAASKTKVEIAQLPEAVKKTLTGNDYKDWKATNAWTNAAEPGWYTVELKKDDKVTSVQIDKDGKVKKS